MESEEWREDRGMSGADAEQGRRGDVCGTAGTPPPTGGLDMGYKTRDGPGKGTAARAGHAPPLRKKAAFFTNRKPCGKQMPRPLGRAGIKSEKAGFRLKNRLIVIFEVKFGFFLPLWGSRGAGPPGVGSALGRLTPAIRLAPDRACGCRRCLHLALPGFAALNRGPTRQTPHHLEPAGLFSVLLLVTKEEQPHGRQPSPACPRI